MSSDLQSVVELIRLNDYTTVSNSFQVVYIGLLQPLLFKLTNIRSAILFTILVVLAIIPTLKQAVEMHRATKQWQPNLYVRQLVKDGILYFLVNLINNVASTLTAEAVTNEMWILFLNVVIYITLCPIIPRFIISIRELYDRDGRGRVQGIDTGFGASSQLVASQDGTVSAIAFADAAPGQDLVAEEEADKPDAIQLEARENGTSRV